MRLVSPRLAPLAGLLLLLAAVGVRAAEVAVDWEQCFLTGVSGGVCPPVDVAVGDTVTFNWAGFHNVVIMPSEADYGECAPGAGEVLAPDAPGGAFPYTVPEGAAGGALYFVCTVPGHCRSGQKITDLYKLKDIIHDGGAQSTVPLGPLPPAAGSITKT